MVPRMMGKAIYLASRSPRRKQLLHQIGVDAVVLEADIDETPLKGEAPALYVERMALEKARAGISTASLSLPVLAADTSVVIDDQILGKPRDEADAVAMLLRLSGRGHQVMTAVALAMQNGDMQVRLSISHVRFRTISEDECRRYWAGGEPADKAGGYGIQGQGAVFVEHLEGSFSGVMGLPLFETAELLKHAGLDVSQRWANGE